MLMSDFFCSWDALENKWFLIQHNTFILIICAQVSVLSQELVVSPPQVRNQDFFLWCLREKVEESLSQDAGRVVWVDVGMFRVPLTYFFGAVDNQGERHSTILVLILPP